jgi:integrase
MKKRVKRQEGFSVYQRPDSDFWFIQYTDPKTGEQARYSSRTTIKDLAIEKAARDYQEAWARKNLNGTVSWSVLRIIQWHVERHLRTKERFSESNYWSILKAPLAAFGHVQADQLKVDALRLYVAQRQQEVKPGTINRELAPFRAAFNMAIKTDNMLRISPFASIPVLSEEPRDRSADGPEEKALIEGTTGLIHDIVEFDFDSGLRAGQIREVRWTDVDFDNRVMRVCSFKGSKGKKYVCWVPIFDRALAVLKRRPKTSEFVFCNKDGGPIPRNGVMHNFDRITARLGIEDFNFHDIRHTFATNHYRRHRDIVVISRILGHTNIRTTQIYLNLTNLDMLQSGARFDPRNITVGGFSSSKTEKKADSHSEARLAQR